MTEGYLLDVSALVAMLNTNHQFHADVWDWLPGKKLAVCPLTELGFIRLMMKPYNATRESALCSLRMFRENKNPQFIPADMTVLEIPKFETARQSTDAYLAELAKKHGLKLATLDARIQHPSAEIIPT